MRLYYMKDMMLSVPEWTSSQIVEMFGKCYCNNNNNNVMSVTILEVWRREGDDTKRHYQ